MRSDVNNKKASWIETFFKLSDYNTNIRTEVIAGITTFAAMSYILVVLPQILSAIGLPQDQLTTAVIIVSALSTLAMGLIANRPYALAPGIAACATLAYVIVGSLNIPVEVAFGMVFISGIFFVFLTATGLRKYVVTVIPASIKYSVGAGVGMFLTLLGLNNGGFLLAKSNNVLNLADLSNPATILAIIGLVIAIILMGLKVKSYPIITILATTLIGIPLGVTIMPDKLISVPANMSGILFKLNVVGALKLNYIPFIFAFFMSDFFSTLGTVLGLGAKAGYLDENGNMEKMDECFAVDSVATVVGSGMCMPVVTTYVESSAGVEVGGRTGLTSITTAVAFLLALIFSPIVMMIPSSATSPVLILIGVSMLSVLKNIDFDDIFEYIPAMLMVTITAFTFNIANGVAISVLTYVLMMTIGGRRKEVSIWLYVLCFPLIYYFFV